MGGEAAGAPVRRHAGRSPGTGRPRRPGAARQPPPDQGHRVPDRRARGVPAARPPPRPGADDRGAGRAGARAPARQDRPARAVHRPRRAPGPQRDAVLSTPRRPPRGVPADRVHADGRARLPGVQPHHPADARDVDHAGGRGSHPGHPPPGPVRGRPADRGHRQRADPRPRRPGCRRHGHPDRQAGAVHGGVRHPSDADAARVARRRDGQPVAARRSAVPRLSSAPVAWRRVRRARRGLRLRCRGGLARLPHPVRGLQAAQRDAPDRAVSGPGPLVQRRHLRDRRGRGGGRARGAARDRAHARGRADRARGGGRGRDRDRAPPATRDARGGRAGGRGGRGDRAGRHERPRPRRPLRSGCFEIEACGGGRAGGDPRSARDRAAASAHDPRRHDRCGRHVLASR